MARLEQLGVDCGRPAALARFWAAALDAVVREDFDDHTWLRDPEGNDFCVTDA